MNKKIYFSIILFFNFLINYVALADDKPSFPDKKGKLVEVYEVKPQLISKNIDLIGTIHSANEAKIFSEVNGVIKEVYFTPGQFVKKGQVIVQLDDYRYKKEYELTKKAADLTKEKYERQKKLYESKNVAKSELDEVQREWVTLELNVSRAKRELEKTIFVAPFDGVVGNNSLTKGSNLKIGQEILTIFDLANVIVEFSVPEPLISKIRVNDQVKVKNYTGKIINFSKIIDPLSMSATAKANLNYAEDLIVGQSVEVNLAIDKITDIAIPFEAMFLEEAKPHVFVVEDSKVKLQPIILGLTGDKYYQVVSGLKEGDKVVLRGQNNLANETLVRFK